MRRRGNRKSSRRDNNSSSSNNMAAVNSSESFWDIGHFKKAVKRVDDGAVVCDELLKMIAERAEIESKYARKLTAWDEKWRKQVQNGPMYATMKNAYLGVLTEAQDRARIHVDCYGKLHNQVVESVKTWKNQQYHKNFMGYWKETKELDEEFTKAQKPWGEGFNKVQRAKRNYHSACKNHEIASEALSTASKEEGFAPEKRKKLEDTVSKQETNVARAKKKYKEKLQRLDPLTISYETEMKKVFNKSQQMEQKKLDFFKHILLEFHKCVNITADERLSKLFKEQLESANIGDVKHDLTWWAENYGADMPQHWPQFEEFVSRQKKKHCKVCADRGPGSLSDCPASCFSVATLNINDLDAELCQFSEEDLAAVRQVLKPIPNHSEASQKLLSSSPEISSSMLGNCSRNKRNSYAVYSNFYKHKDRFVDQMAQDEGDSFLDDRDTCSLLSRDVATEQDVVEVGEADGLLEKLDSCRTETSADSVKSEPSDSTQNLAWMYECNIDLMNCKLMADCSPTVDQDIHMSYNVYSVSDRSFQKSAVDASQAQYSSLEFGETNTPSFSDNDIAEKTIEAESTYQVPRRMDSQPNAAFTDHNGKDNPFLANDGSTKSDDEWDVPPPEDDNPGVPVRALYTYSAVEDDELSFQSGDVFAKLSDEDAQGWCRGRIQGKVGLYPANYVESV
eukprot:gene18151-19962_t